MLGKQVPGLLLAGVLLLVVVNVFMDQTPTRQAAQPAAGSTEMLTRIRRDMVGQQRANGGTPGAVAVAVSADSTPAPRPVGKVVMAGGAVAVSPLRPLAILNPVRPVPGPASDAAKALAAKNGGASKLPPPLNTLEPGTDIFVSFASASMAPFALNWVANLQKAGINELLVGALDAEMCVSAEAVFVFRDLRRNPTPRPQRFTLTRAPSGRAVCSLNISAFQTAPPGRPYSREPKKHSPNTGAHANNTLQVTRPPHRGAC